METSLSVYVSEILAEIKALKTLIATLATKDDVAGLFSKMPTKTDVAKVSNVVVAGADASSQDGKEEIVEHDNIELASVVVQEFEPARIQLVPAPASVRGDIIVHNVDNNSVDIFSEAVSTSPTESETQIQLVVVETEVPVHSIDNTALLLKNEWLVQERDKTGNAFDATALLFRARKSFRGARNVEFNRGLFRPFDIWCRNSSKKHSYDKSSNYNT